MKPDLRLPFIIFNLQKKIISKYSKHDQASAQLEIHRLQTCEKSHAIHQVGVWRPAMIIPFRTP